MYGVRQLIRSSRSNRLLVLWIAYSLCVQAIMASVGLGMSAFAAPAPDGLVICSHASATTPAPAGERQNPSPTPCCPFCFVAAQSAGYIALDGKAPPVPVYAGLPIAPLPDRSGGAGFVPRFRRMVGAPRAPPAFSV
jgi:hypothetical protein